MSDTFSTLPAFTRSGPGVAVGMTINGYRSLRRSDAAPLEAGRLGWIASTPARDASVVRRPGGSSYELRFSLNRSLSRADTEALCREISARLIRLAEEAGHVGAFAFEFFPLGEMRELSKSAVLAQVGTTKTAAAWRKAFTESD